MNTLKVRQYLRKKNMTKMNVKKNKTFKIRIKRVRKLDKKLILPSFNLFII